MKHYQTYVAAILSNPLFLKAIGDRHNGGQSPSAEQVANAVQSLDRLLNAAPDSLNCYEIGAQEIADFEKEKFKQAVRSHLDQKVPNK